MNNKELIVKLSGASFNANLTKENWSLDLPDGLDFKLERVNDSTVKIILTGEAIQDFDTDLKVLLNVDAKEFNGLEGTSLVQYVNIKAVDDEEVLVALDEVEFNSETLNLTIKGGTFKDDVAKHFNINR